MKHLFLPKALIITTFLLTFSTLLKAQACKERHTTDSLEYRVLSDYISECRMRYFDYHFDKDSRRMMPMGVILLKTYVDTLGQRNWELWYSLNDSFRDNPPAAYDVIDMDVVLIYDADSQGNIIYPKPSDELDYCISSVVTDRVYKTRPATYRWFDDASYKDSQSKLVKYTSYGSRVGNTHNVYHIIFKKDGTYQKWKGF